MSAPLISVSFGSSAIFLVGGQTKQIRPRAIQLNSGDVVIMKDSARLAYHGVPKIFKNESLKTEFDYDENELENLEKRINKYYVNNEKWKILFEYIRINRINLNIRQVN
jgi:alkylated DNA repair protein alkB family protein 1